MVMPLPALAPQHPGSRLANASSPSLRLAFGSGLSARSPDALTDAVAITVQEDITMIRKIKPCEHPSDDLQHIRTCEACWCHVGLDSRPRTNIISRWWMRRILRRCFPNRQP
jgi:hypothetical protein